MALQTKTYTVGKTEWDSWYTGYQLELVVNEDSVNTAENYSTVSYTFKIKVGNNAYEAYTPYEVKLNGVTVSQGTPYFYLAKNSEKVLATGTTQISHSNDGTLTMSVYAAIEDSYNANGSANVYAPPPMKITDTMSLTKIDRVRPITFNGQEILNVVFNGQPVTHLIYNGNTIF